MNLACSEYKPNENALPHGLAEFNEVIDVLLKVEELEGSTIAIFPSGALSLPLELAEKVRELQGKKIAILRLYGYHVCCLDGEKHA